MTDGPTNGTPADPSPTDDERGIDEGSSDVGRAAADAARGSAFRQLAGEQFSVMEVIGGVRGLVESVAPALVFIVVYIVTREIVPPLVASLTVAVVAVVARLVNRTPITQAAGGFLGVGVGVVWAWRTGDAEDFFALGLWTNAAYALALVISILVRWPAVGVVVSLLKGQDFSWRTGWRTDPVLSLRRRRYLMATWLWIAMFALRLAVQVPLFLDAAVAWLGTARLVMGLPLWALTLWLTWVLVRERASAATR